jgi:hypothetical protein
VPEEVEPNTDKEHKVDADLLELYEVLEYQRLIKEQEDASN